MGLKQAFFYITFFVFYLVTFVPGVNKKQENSFSFPRQKFRSPCNFRSNFAPTPLIYQFLLVFKQQFFEVTKKTFKKTEKCAKKLPFLINPSVI